MPGYSLVRSATEAYTVIEKGSLLWMMNIYKVHVTPLPGASTTHPGAPLPGFESMPGHVRKLPVTWG